MKFKILKVPFSSLKGKSTWYRLLMKGLHQWQYLFEILPITGKGKGKFHLLSVNTNACTSQQLTLISSVDFFTPTAEVTTVWLI